MKSEHHTETKSAKTKTNWGTAIFLIIAHVAAIAALFFWSWPAVITAVILYWVGGSLGIGMGWHRLLTHRGYKVPKVVEYFLVTCGTMALEGGPIQWVVTHRIHHAMVAGGHTLAGYCMVQHRITAKTPSLATHLI
jgi:stearoyl-CoA desaturase (delta-9 desaturase)